MARRSGAGASQQAVRGANFGEDPYTYGFPTADLPYVTSNPGVGSGRIEAFHITAPATVTITKMRALNGGGAAAGITLARLGIYEQANPPDATLTLVGATPNDTAMFNASNQFYVANLQTPVTMLAGHRYALAVLFVGTTMPLMASTVAQTWVGSVMATTPPVRACYRSGSSDLPASIPPGEQAFNVVGVRYLVASP